MEQNDQKRGTEQQAAQSHTQKTAPQQTAEPKENKSSKGETKPMATMKFLKSCEPYQAEAIRVMKVLAEERGDIFSMRDYDKAMVNNFLNLGLVKQAGLEFYRVIEHRNSQATKLMQSMTPFIDGNTEETVYISAQLLKVVAAPEAVKRFLE